MPYYGFDITYFILVLPAFLLAMAAQSKVKSTFSKYSKIANRNGFTGADVAKQLLLESNIYDVEIQPVKGSMTDHYDPRKKVIRLSETVYNSKSISAISVAAHETGHAIQDAESYTFLKMRNSIAPVVTFCSSLASPLIGIGIMLVILSTRGSMGYTLVQAGIVLFSAVVLFQVITLPVEFNASSRALERLEIGNYLTIGEIEPAKKVLNAAALTYVAAAAVSIANLLRLVLLFGGRRRSD